MSAILSETTPGVLAREADSVSGFYPVARALRGEIRQSPTSETPPENGFIQVYIVVVISALLNVDRAIWDEEIERVFSHQVVIPVAP